MSSQSGSGNSGLVKLDGCSERFNPNEYLELHIHSGLIILNLGYKNIYARDTEENRKRLLRAGIALNLLRLLEDESGDAHKDCVEISEANESVAFFNSGKVDRRLSKVP